MVFTGLTLRPVYTHYHLDAPPFLCGDHQIQRTLAKDSQNTPSLATYIAQLGFRMPAYGGGDRIPSPASWRTRGHTPLACLHQFGESTRTLYPAINMEVVLKAPCPFTSMLTHPGQELCKIRLDQPWRFSRHCAMKAVGSGSTECF